jgi:glyoxylase-like metal-dependent hydrolase (beta-lactamase superfamily II)
MRLNESDRGMSDAPTDPRIVDLEFQGHRGVIGSFLFDDGREVGLVETGPASTIPSLLTVLATLEDGLERLTSIVVTHVHLDHAGGVGELLRRAPNAHVFVHEVGAPHLVDPSKLLRSAARIYGDQMEPLWGNVIPAAADRVVAVEDNEILSVGGHTLRVLYTPGHASHHIALHEESTRSVFTGDVAGVRMQGATHVRPPTPPPDIDLEEWKSSVNRITALHPEWLYLTHFGRFGGDASTHCQALLQRLEVWTEMVRVSVEDGVDVPAIVGSLQREGDAEAVFDGADFEQLRRYELATPYGMNVDGLLRFLQKTEGKVSKSADR